MNLPDSRSDGVGHSGAHGSLYTHLLACIEAASVDVPGAELPSVPSADDQPADALGRTGAAIRVAFTERHGMAMEASRFGPPSVHYSFGTPVRERPRVLRSPMKGYMRTYAFEDVDLIEAVLSPIVTDRRWIYSCENLQAAAAFSILGVPVPRTLRIRYIHRLLSRDNCRRVVFWSRAGRSTLQSYGGMAADDRLMQKVTVVYPGVRRIPDQRVRSGGAVTTLLFSGDFFRKGGVNVVDAFARARVEFPHLTLLLCCDESIDFNTPNRALRAEYLAKAQSTAGIEWLGRVSRDEMVNTVLPQADIYLLPTYAETFGMSILEAMACGIPVIATNVFAIPEVIADNETGVLIDVSEYDCEKLFRGYVVRDIPESFRTTVTEQLLQHICRLADSPDECLRLGRGALERARSTFSFETRNAQMLEIYRRALA